MRACVPRACVRACSSEVEDNCTKACRKLLSFRITSLASWKQRGSDLAYRSIKADVLGFIGNSFSPCSAKMSERQRPTNSPSMLLSQSENDTLMQVLGRGCVVSARREWKMEWQESEDYLSTAALYDYVPIHLSSTLQYPDFWHKCNESSKTVVLLKWFQCTAVCTWSFCIAFRCGDGTG